MGDVAKYDKLPLPRLLRDQLAILGRVPIRIPSYGKQRGPIPVDVLLK